MLYFDLCIWSSTTATDLEVAVLSKLNNNQNLIPWSENVTVAPFNSSKLVEYGVNFFSLFFPLFDNAAFTKYILHERCSDEEFIKHHLSTLPAGCKIFVFRVKN